MRVDGNAERNGSGIAVKLSKPKDKTFTLDAKVAFPTEQMRKIIEAAEAGKTLLEFPVLMGRKPERRCSTRSP